MEKNLTPVTLGSLSILTLGLTLGAGCATLPRGPGHLDERIAAGARSETAKELEMVLGPGGALTKVAVENSAVDKVPEAVRKLAESTFPGGTLTEHELEVYEDGALIHEVEVKTADGKECEVSATEAGVLRYTECKLAASDIPEAVKKTLDATVASAEITEAEIRKSADAGEEYRIEVKAGARKWYLRIKPDGTLIAKAAVLEAEVVVPIP